MSFRLASTSMTLNDVDEHFRNMLHSIAVTDIEPGAFSPSTG